MKETVKNEYIQSNDGSYVNADGYLVVKPKK